MLLYQGWGTKAASSAQGKDQNMAKTNMALASPATLVAAHVKATNSMGVEHEHLALVIIAAVNVCYAGDIMTLTTAAATGITLLEILTLFCLVNV